MCGGHTALGHSGLHRRGCCSPPAKGEHWELSGFLEHTGAVPTAVNSPLLREEAQRVAARYYAQPTHIHGNLTPVYILPFSSDTRETFPATNTADAAKTGTEHTLCWAVRGCPQGAELSLVSALFSSPRGANTQTPFSISEPLTQGKNPEVRQHLISSTVVHM